MVNRASAELADDKLPNDAWEFLFEAYSKHDGQVWRPAGQPDKGWTSRKVEANITLTVLSAMMTKEEKKLMRRRSTAGSRAENPRLAEKAETMTKQFFREWFERDGIDLPNNLRRAKKRDSKGKTTAGASQLMVLSSVSNILRTLQTNKDDPGMHVDALKKWAAEYRVNEASFREFCTGLPPPVEEPAPRPGSWAARGIGAAQDALGWLGASGGGASSGGAAL